MLAGPGAISTAILLQNQAKDVAQHFALYGCILGVSFVSDLILRLSARGARWLNPIAMSISIRIMGLLLAAGGHPVHVERDQKHPRGFARVMHGHVIIGKP